MAQMNKLARSVKKDDAHRSCREVMTRRPRHAIFLLASMSWDAHAFLRPATELLSSADALRTAGSVTEAAQYGFAAFMLASTHGSRETIHGKKLTNQYSLSELSMEKAMRLWTDGMKHDSEVMNEFTTWFNEDVLADPEHDDHGGRDLVHTLLREAIEQGDVSQVREILMSGMDVNVPDMQGNFLLEGAAADGNASIVKLLLLRGARVTQGNPHGSTALHGAAFFGRPAALRLLVDALPAGTSVDLEDENGNTPLVAASATSSPANQDDRIACVKLLLSKGARAKKAYNTAAHTSVMALLGAATGRKVSQAAIADAEAHNQAEHARVNREWKEAFNLAVEAGALLRDEVKEEVEGPLQLIQGEGSEVRRSQKMLEQLKALQSSTLGDMIRPGRRVELEGLAAKPELNGAKGRVASYVPSKGRYVVKLEADGGAKPITVKVPNVRETDVPEYDDLVSEGEE
jgi:ankyrin repeat protein